MPPSGRSAQQVGRPGDGLAPPGGVRETQAEAVIGAAPPDPSEALFRRTFDAAAVGLAHLDPEGRWLLANRAMARITGFEPHELRQRTTSDLTHPDDLGTTRALMGRLVSGEVPEFSREERWLRKDGTVVWVQLTASLATDPAGAPYVVAVVEDISARKSVEIEHRKVLELVEHSSDFIATADLAGRVTYLNQGGRAMIGLDPCEDVSHLHFGDYVPEEWQPYFLQTLVRTAREQGRWHGEVQLRNVRTGRPVHVSRSAFLVRDPTTNGPWCYATIARDITRQKATEHALQLAHRQLRATLTATDVGLWDWDPRTDAYRGDRNLLKLFGLEGEGDALPLAPWIERIHPDDRAQVVAAVTRALERGGLYDEVFRIVHPEAGVRWLHARGVVEHGPDGHAVAFPGIGLDVTDRVEAEARFRESDERYRALLESVDEGFCVIDLVFDAAGERAIDYRFVELNRSFARQMGLTDATGRMAREVIPDVDRFWYETYGRVALTGEPARFLRHEPSMRRWFEVEALRVGAPERHRVAVLFRDVTQQRETEENLRRSEARFRALVEQAPVGVSIFAGPELRIELANAAVEELLGRTGLAGKTLAEALPDLPPDATFTTTLRRAMQTGAPAHVAEHPVPLRREDRLEERIVFVSLQPLDVPGDPVRRVMNVAIDVTAQVRARREVEELVARLRETDQRAREAAATAEAERRVLDAILEAAPAGIIVADAEGRIQRTNHANLLLWGPTPPAATPEEYRTWKGWWAEPPERRGRRVEPHEWAMARALRGETVRDDIVEIEPFDQPGTRRTMVNTGAPVRDSAGRIVGAVVAQMNVTDLVAAQAARRDSEARFRALADNMAQLAWMADETGAITWFNRRWLEFTGGAPAEMVGWGWRVVPHPDHLERVVRTFREHLGTGEPWEDTFPMRARDGSYRWFLTRAVPVRDESGRVVRWFGTNTDVTAQREAQEALREADRRKDEFISILAHELRNPLAPVRHAVEILRRVGPEDPLLVRAREVIERQVAHMARLVDDLLDVSRIARGKLELHREPCDLAAIARLTAEDYRSSVEAAGLTLSVEVPEEPLWVDGDPVRLAQMVGNLLNNAVRFTERGGRVEVGAEVDPEGWAQVRVRDTGVGIEPVMLSRLFDPFSQADQGLARSKGGLGLGLAVTQGLAELHGGKVAAESPGAGRGSTFTIRLPPCPTCRRPTADESARVREGLGLRVLIVEDNRDSAQTLGDLFELGGHRVRLAYDGVTALAAAREFDPEVVVSDIGLPGELDGYAVARALRASPADRRPYLIALSGYANEAARRRSREAGFDVHFAKPPDIDALERTLEDVLALRRSPAGG